MPFVTILHHLSEPWKLKLRDQAYYFCDDPDCDVAYFGIDKTLIMKDQLRTRIGVKEKTEEALICYCFGVSVKQAQTDQQARLFVLEQTRNSRCTCETSNPSGRCCLKDIPK